LSSLKACQTARNSPTFIVRIFATYPPNGDLSTLVRSELQRSPSGWPHSKMAAT
jgi:hypothetical protein